MRSSASDEADQRMNAPISFFVFRFENAPTTMKTHISRSSTQIIKMLRQNDDKQKTAYEKKEKC